MFRRVRQMAASGAKLLSTIVEHAAEYADATQNA